MAETLGALLRRRRRERRLTQAAAARACGLTRMHLWALENDRSRNPTISVLAPVMALYALEWKEVREAWRAGAAASAPRPAEEDWRAKPWQALPDRRAA